MSNLELRKRRALEVGKVPIKSGVLRVLLDGLSVESGGFEVITSFELLISFIFQRLNSTRLPI